MNALRQPVNRPCDRINTAVPIVERPDLAERLHPELRAVGARVFMMNGCSIILSNEPQGWHISIARRDRDPTWEEIATIRYRLLPDLPEMAMFLPPMEEYVNIHDHCFHLYEQRRSSLILP